MISPKAVFITGAARRIGKAIALEFAHNGYDIALHYHRSERDALATQAEIRALGRQCVLLQQDLTQLEALPALMQQAKEALPALCVLVNNASTFRRISFSQTMPESLTQDFTTNFMQPFFLTQAFTQSVERGAVVNMLDTAIATHRTTHFGYLLAKKTLAEFTQMAAKDLGPVFRVNAVAPGFTLPTEGGTNRDPAEYAAKLPLLQQPTPGQIAAAVSMLAENDALTGHILYIDGGERLL